MAGYYDLEILKLSKELVPYTKEKFTKFIEALCFGLEDKDRMIQTMISEVELTIFNGMDNAQLHDSITLTACQNIQENTDFDKLASRMVVLKMYQNALDTSLASDFDSAYRESFKKYIKKGIELKLLDKRLDELFDLDELARTINYDRDDLYDYIGADTAFKRYMVKEREDEESSIETPQFMWMRIAMGISYNEENPTEQAKKFYEKYSKLECIPGGSTNIGSGTTFPALSNCFLLDTEDDIKHIFDNVKNIALISKATGGIGISVTKLRANGSPVRSNNTFSTGPIPFIKVMDSALKSVSRAGKKAGAMAVYMENWHIDFPEFLDLRQNAGDDYRRIRTADTAVYISDEFMKRVINDQDWYLFDPLEVPELTELYGSEFSKKYNEYVAKADRGGLRMHSKMPAREQMKKILTSLLSTSHPWLTWKDTINLRALNNNTGTIHSSNLCTEVCLPQDRDNIAVCNLFTVNLARHIKESGANEEDKIDWNKLRDSVKLGMRHLDNLIDVNMLYVDEAKNSDSKNRAVGLGIMGFSEILEKLGYAYDSPEAYDVIDRLIEFISYNSIEASCDLAEERGSYQNFEGSMWSKGFVPFDTIDKVAKDRIGEKEDTNDPVKQGLELIKRKIQEGSQNAENKDTRELYELFEQLTQYMATSNQDTEGKSGVDYIKPLENRAHEGIELIQNRKIRMDWETLRERVRKGVRNATTMMTAPNASIGLLAGTTPGMDPRFANIFSRATSRGKFLDINKNLVADLKRLGIWEDVKGKVLEYYGDITQIEEIPENLKNIYKTSFQISPYAFLEVASRAQKWIDQSISRNMYLDTRDVDELVDIYTEAWRRGVKTTYYLHVKPRHTAEQSTVKVNKGKALNKAGFGTVNQTLNAEVPEIAKVEATQQMTLDGEKEVKGFGFARNVDPIIIEPKLETQTQSVPVVEAKEEVVVASASSSGGFGFGKVSSPSAGVSDIKEEKANFKEPVINKAGFACPIDPAERAQCLACQ